MKNILLTGITRGIGKATCIKLIEDGYFVYGTYNTSKEEGEKMKKELKNIEIYQADFSNRNSTNKLIQELQDITFHGIVNNAGIILFEDWDSFSMKTWDTIMEVNVNAPLMLAHALRNNITKGGSILNIASTDGLVGALSSIAYSASKAALINLTLSLANAFGPKNIRVNAIAPGWIGDGMGSPAIPFAEWIIPFGRTATYEEVADLIVFLLSDKSTYINGSTQIIDGGRMAVDFVMKKEAELTAKS